MDNQANCCNCFWHDQCRAAGLCQPGCDDHTPIDDNDDLKQYASVLSENVAEYHLVEEEYSDGRDS